MLPYYEFKAVNILVCTVVRLVCLVAAAACAALAAVTNAGICEALPLAEYINWSASPLFHIAVTSPMLGLSVLRFIITSVHAIFFLWLIIRPMLCSAILR